MVQVFDEKVAAGYLNVAKEDDQLNVTDMRSIITGFARAGFDFTGTAKMIVTWRERDERRTLIANGLSRDYLLIGHFNENKRLVGKFIKIGISPKLIFPEHWNDEQRTQEIIAKYPIYWGNSRLDGRPFLTAGPAGDPANLKTPTAFDFMSLLDDSLKGSITAPAGLPIPGGVALTAAQKAAQTRAAKKAAEIAASLPA